MKVKIEFNPTEVTEALYTFAVSEGLLKKDGETIPSDYVIYCVTNKGIEGDICIEASGIPHEE